MINVTVNGTEQIKCNKGDNLYQVLTAAGYVFAGNCGMKGRCNRCLDASDSTGFLCIVACIGISRYGWRKNSLPVLQGIR